LVAVAVLVLPDTRVDVGDGGATLTVYLLASYVLGHALTILSRLLTWLRIRTRGYRSRNYSFFPQLQKRLRQAFGEGLGAAEEYHLSHALAIESCPRSSERIERYFALALLMRNLACATLISALIIGSAGLYRWAGLFAILVGLFVYQHDRFEATLERTVFRTAFLVFTLPEFVNRQVRSMAGRD
jgi:hypothetical protein